MKDFELGGLILIGLFVAFIVTLMISNLIGKGLAGAVNSIVVWVWEQLKLLMIMAIVSSALFGLAWGIGWVVHFVWALF